MEAINIEHFRLELHLHESFEQNIRDTVCRIEKQRLFLSSRSSGFLEEEKYEVLHLEPAVLENIIRRFEKEGLLAEDRQYFNPQKAEKPGGLVRISLLIETENTSYVQTHFGDKSQLFVYDFINGWLEYLENLIKWEMQDYPRLLPMRKAVA